MTQVVSRAAAKERRGREVESDIVGNAHESTRGHRGVLRVVARERHHARAAPRERWSGLRCWQREALIVLRVDQ